MHSRGLVHNASIAGSLGRFPRRIFAGVDIESVLLDGGGLATTSQLLTVVSRKRLSGLVKSGRLIRICHGVYAARQPDVSEALAALQLMAGRPVVACMGT